MRQPRTQGEVAEKAGMSERQQLTGSQGSFDAQVESAGPPTITMLAEQSTNSQPVREATKFTSDWERLRRRLRRVSS